MKKSRVFIDSNIWFSAFYKKGVCSELLRSLHKASWEIVISELVLEEVIRNIKEKIPHVLALVIEYFNTVKPTVVKNPLKDKVPTYRDLASLHDLPILIAAVEYRCAYFITGNIKDFKSSPIKKKSGLRIVTPSDFLKLLEEKN